MIIVDDEADYNGIVERPNILKKPSRTTLTKSRQDNSAGKTPLEPHTNRHVLDAKAIIDRAMDLGLICSMMRPAKNEDGFEDRVVKASEHADIVCLDWEINNDGGDVASRIISHILENDDKLNGRVRCIAIYTGDTDNNKILDKILSNIPQHIQEKQEMKGARKTNLEISGKYGVRIVCLFKSHGIQLEDDRKVNQITESELPKRLQDEFSKLSEGVLSNVALATIASIREITHQILARFPGDLDGPWFHHRATITNPEEAEEYAINVVLSEIKGAIDIRAVGKKHAGGTAIEARIQEIANGHSSDPQSQTLRCETNSVNYDLALKDVIKFVKSGLREENIMLPDGRSLPKKKIKGVIKPHFSSLFYRDWRQARKKMDRFASLTGVRSHPGSYPGSYLSIPQWVPMLGFGTIIKPSQAPENEQYLLCLQASCDTVRVGVNEGKFIFVPLERVSEDCHTNHDHVVPVPDEQGSYDHIGLKVHKMSYRAMFTITFPPSDMGVVEAEARSICGESSKEFIFSDSNKQEYRWIADIKRRRALRTAQDLGRKLGRLGFDEFEPYRKSLT